MGKLGKFDHLHLIYLFTVPSNINIFPELKPGFHVLVERIVINFKGYLRHKSIFCSKVALDV